MEPLLEGNISLAQGGVAQEIWAAFVSVTCFDLGSKKIEDAHFRETFREGVELVLDAT